ncbi:MAG TPA: GNAT family N-acetyltransferase [Ktedonobacterales bacterium]
MMKNGWQLQLEADDEEAYAAFAADEIWNGYSIGDLVPPFCAHAQVALAARGGAAAACLLLRQPELTVLIPSGDPDGLAAILRAVDLPARTYLLMQAPHRAAIEQVYVFSAAPEPMLRMALSVAAFRPAAGWEALAERLGPPDVPLLAALYATYAASVFRAEQIAVGPVYGVRPQGQLIAAAGTHAFARPYGIAAIGNILTHPEHRGNGYASAATSAVVAALVAEGCRTVVLNVAQANATAQRVYTRLGFHAHCAYLEGVATRRTAVA